MRLLSINRRSVDPIDTFIARWQSAGGSECANYQLFVTELCERLDLPKAEPRIRQLFAPIQPQHPEPDPR